MPHAQTRQVSVAEAKAHLSEILDAVIAGTEVVITRRGKPVARLSAPQKQKKPFDMEKIRKLTEHLPIYPGSSVEDMRNEDRY